ncbi:histidine kinase [Hymenobacter roseosalivarius DSM 11622]|uniref:Oxygen sensor histidine kinase NreB n=1 Tax=Hymenobacter roseosalivarius DSM 11622 TaxID=645990 RepID=A0A1W1VAJ2_9BACT|nr:sensor histidine kinase [Hymenobacter roseosalivarius]SMB90378.1 histidine kinase [Hymenobacter roseosalivarius DSM 11622]
MTKTLLPFLLITPILLLLAGGIIVFVIRDQRRRLRQQLQMQQLREDAQQQALEAALLAQEEERQRIAADLHDGVGTTLAIAKMHLHALGDPARTKEATDLLDQVITEVRRISRNLLPAALQKFGLPFALDALARTVPPDGHTKVIIEQDGTPRRLDPGLELIVYRIAQELLGNGLKHAQASLLRIAVDFQPQQLSLHYSDNGVGFNPIANDVLPALGTRTGLGLTNLRSRVAVLRGTLHHESAPGDGTRVWITLPLPYLVTDEATINTSIHE